MSNSVRDAVYAQLFGDLDDLIEKVEKTLPELSVSQIAAMSDARNHINTSVDGLRGHLDDLQGRVNQISEALFKAAAEIKIKAQDATDAASKGASEKAISDINLVAEMIKMDIAVAARTAASMAVAEGVAGALAQVVASARSEVEKTAKELSWSVGAARERIDHGAEKVAGASRKVVLFTAGAAFVAGMCGSALATLYANDALSRVLVSRVTAAAAEAAGKTSGEQAYDAYNAQQERAARIRANQQQGR